MSPAANRVVTRALMVAAVVGVGVVFSAIGLRVAGLLIPYKIPLAGMSPTLQPDDLLFTEGVTYRFRQPQRGELLVFDSSGIRGLEPGSIFIKRLVGLPGDRLRISGNQLFVNGQATVYTDTEGKPIHYIQAGSFLRIPTDEIVLPPDCFFVLGDNSKNSFDSRYWGQVPRANIRGRAWFRYWPLR